MEENSYEKNIYIPPTIMIEYIQLEESFCAGSAVQNPANSNNEINDQWEADPDNNNTMSW